LGRALMLNPALHEAELFFFSLVSVAVPETV